MVWFARSGGDARLGICGAREVQAIVSGLTNVTLFLFPDNTSVGKPWHVLALDPSSLFNGVFYRVNRGVQELRCLWRCTFR